MVLTLSCILDESNDQLWLLVEFPGARKRFLNVCWGEVFPSRPRTL